MRHPADFTLPQPAARSVTGVWDRHEWITPRMAGRYLTSLEPVTPCCPCSRLPLQRGVPCAKLRCLLTLVPESWSESSALRPSHPANWLLPCEILVNGF